MRIFVAIILSFTLVQTVSAQQERFRQDSIAIAKLGSTMIKLAACERADSAVLPLFESIYCTDARLDTSCIGVMEGRTTKRIKLFPTIPLAIISSLAGFESAEKGSGILHVYVKKLRLVLFDSMPRYEHKGFMAFRVVAEIEAYYETGDRLYPAFRIDTSYTMKGEDVKDFAEMLSPLTRLLAAKCTSLNIDRVVRRNSYAHAEIVQRYAKNTVNEFPARGIYRSVREFQNNTPSITNFNATQKKGYFQFTGPNDSIIHYKSIFIYSDGTRAWVCTDGELSPLIRQNNRFEFYKYQRTYPYRTTGLRVLDEPSGSFGRTFPALANAAVMDDLMTKIPETSKKYYYLDIETGEIY